MSTLNTSALLTNPFGNFNYEIDVNNPKRTPTIGNKTNKFNSKLPDIKFDYERYFKSIFYKVPLEEHDESLEDRIGNYILYQYYQVLHQFLEEFDATLRDLIRILSDQTNNFELTLKLDVNILQTKAKDILRQHNYNLEELNRDNDQLEQTLHLINEGKKKFLYNNNGTVFDTILRMQKDMHGLALYDFSNETRFDKEQYFKIDDDLTNAIDYLERQVKPSDIVLTEELLDMNHKDPTIATNARNFYAVMELLQMISQQDIYDALVRDNKLYYEKDLIQGGKINQAAMNRIINYAQNRTNK